MSVPRIPHFNTGDNASGITVSENYAYIADKGAGLRIINVSDPSAPIEVGYYNTFGLSQGVCLSGDYIYVADGSGGLCIFSFEKPTIVEDVDSKGKMEAFQLSQNYPNPFNPVTTIEYNLKTSSKVNLFIYNSLGQVVRVLIDEMQPEGIHTIIWDGRNGNGIELPNGMYFCCLEVGNYIQTRKMVLTK